jgi:hypothetical protein
MKNFKIVDIELPGGSTAKYVVIDRGNEGFTSMLKSTYDEMTEEQSTPIDTEDE